MNRHGTQLGRFRRRLEYLEARRCLSTVAFVESHVECCAIPGGPNGSQLFDWDHDGDDDFLFSTQDRTVAWMENIDGGAAFREPQALIQTEYGVGRFALVDLDHDGDLDIVVASGKDNLYRSRIDWFENTDGLGKFSNAKTITAATSGVTGLAFADLDGDTRTDIIVSSNWEASLFWYRQTDNVGVFETVASLASRETPNWLGQTISMVFDDVDADGDLDIITASSGYDGALFWFENLQQENAFGLPQTIVRYERFRPTLGPLIDLDGDGDRDLISTSADEGDGFGLQWFPNLGDGNFGAPVRSKTTGYIFSIEAHDLDRDGDLDLIATAGTNAGNSLIWLENEDTRFTEQSLFTPTRSRKFYLGDIDGDEDHDAIVVDSDISWYERLDDRVEFAQRDTLTLAEIGEPHAVDVDRDGQVDIMQRSYQVSSWIMNDGDGNFAEPERRIAQPYHLGDRSLTVDIDGDGDQDLVAFYSNTSQLTWRENRVEFGEGFEPPRDLGPNPSRRSRVIEAGDLDNDGDQDLVIAGGHGLHWLENEGGRISEQHRLAQGTGAHGNSPRSLAVVDIDGDGDLDVWTGSYDHILTSFRNDGRGQFSRSQELRVRDNVLQSLTPFDADGDGDLDLLALGIDLLGIRVVVYENLDGRGDLRLPELVAFYPRDPFDSVSLSSVELGPIRLGDMNNDGRDDVVFGYDEFFLSEVLWLENRGSLFDAAPLKPIATEGGQRRLLGFDIADFDGDGFDDVVVGWSNRISMYRSRTIGDSNGDGSFDSSDLVQVLRVGKFELAQQPATFDEGDWNQDGRFDSSDLVYALQAGMYETDDEPLVAASGLQCDLDCLAAALADRTLLSKRHALRGARVFNQLEKELGIFASF